MSNPNLTFVRYIQYGDEVWFDPRDFEEGNGSVSIKDGSNGVTTLYVGSKKSETYLCFYKKNYEQAENMIY